MGTSGNASVHTDHCDCKIGHLTEKYGLGDLPQEVGKSWKHDEENASFRDLAERVNKQILKSEVRQQSRDPLIGEVQHLYDLLTDDEISPADQVKARKRLESDGIDVDDVVSDFVSYQTVNRHIKNCLDITKRNSDGASLSPETAIRRISALQNRTAAVTENTLDQLNRAGVLELDDFDVMVNISVVDNDEDAFYTVDEVINGDRENDRTTEE